MNKNIVQIIDETDKNCFCPTCGTGLLSLSQVNVDVLIKEIARNLELNPAEVKENLLNISCKNNMLNKSEKMLNINPEYSGKGFTALPKDDLMNDIYDFIDEFKWKLKSLLQRR